MGRGAVGAGLSSSAVAALFSPLVHPWLMGLKNGEGECIEEGCREQELSIPVTAGSSVIFFLCST